MLGGAVALSCQGDPACDREPLEVIVDTGGYMAVPLTGIWASPPYLHNGSVPDLRSVITGDKSTGHADIDTTAKWETCMTANAALGEEMSTKACLPAGAFYRGNIQFDQKNVGFVSNRKTSLTGKLYFTDQSGNGNSGHLYGPKGEDGNLDWSKNQVNKLLEYLKTK